MLTFTDEQQKVVDYILEQVSLGGMGKNVIVSGQGGVGKALPNDTLIPTPTGDKRMGDLQVGDFVFDRQGKPTKVIGVYPQGIKKCYELTFTSGRKARCCEDHLWSFCDRKTGKINATWAVKEILDSWEFIDGRGYKNHPYCIPNNGKVEYSTKDFKVDPYIIGAFLGDGCLTEPQLTISSATEEIPGFIGEILGLQPVRSPYNYSWFFELKEKEGKKKYLQTKDLFKDVPEMIGMTSNFKYIPKEYLYGDINQRISLLQGLFDTDGSARKERNGIRFSSNSEELLQQIRRICLSLGLRVSGTIVDQRIHKYSNGYHGSILITGEKIFLSSLFRIARKRETVKNAPPARARFELLTLTNVEEKDPCEMTCIMVDNEEHLFLTEDFLPTHNTEMVTELVCMLLADGKRVAVSAMTGKATAVLRQKVNKKLWDRKMVWRDDSGVTHRTFPKENLFIETIQKMTKESKIIDVNDAGETIYSNTWRDPRSFHYDVLIIDELSMVPHYVSLWWQKTEALVIGLGDFCQLPEVTTGESQKELSGFRHDLHIETPKLVSGYGIKVLRDLSQCHLTKVLRSDNEIALLSDDLRDFTQSKRQVCETIKEWADKAPDVVKYSKNLEDLETDPDWQIICYTNKMCGDINEALCMGGEYPINEDKILLYDNIPPLQKYNGDTMTLQELLDSIKKYNNNPKNVAKQITVILKWKNKMPTKDSKYRLERQMFQQYVIFKDSVKRIQTMRMNALPGILESTGYAAAQIEEWKQEIEQMRAECLNDGECFSKIVQRFYELDRDMAQKIMEKAPPLPRMYVVHIDYGYAITVHKSQGSQYKKVCYVMDRFDHPLLYTAVSRAEKEVRIIDLLKVS